MKQCSLYVTEGATQGFLTLLLAFNPTSHLLVPPRRCVIPYDRQLHYAQVVQEDVAFEFFTAALFVRLQMTYMLTDEDSVYGRVQPRLSTCMHLLSKV